MEKTEYKDGRKLRRKPSLDMGSMVFGKIPPQSKELEESVLGAIMLEKNAFDIVSEILKAESFYVDAHQKIFAAMVSLAGKNMPIDEMTLMEELKIKEHLEAIGGPYYLTKLTQHVVSAANIDSHSRIVAQKFIQRELIRISGEIIGDAYDDSTDVFDLLDSSDKKLTDLISGNISKNYKAINEAVMDSIIRIEGLRKLESHITGIPSGFQDIDRVTHGWQDTDLVVLAARPSVGKTAFALNLARNAAQFFYDNWVDEKKQNPLAKKKGVGFFSLEMSTGQLIDRMLSTESEIMLDYISTGRLDDEQMRHLYKKGVDRLCEMPIFIDDSAALNIFELRAKARRMKNKNNIGFILIDYLQLMSGSSDRGGNREQEISKISRDLKSLAKELKVPIIALSQLSREVEKRKGEIKMPQLSDLRESGAIEQDADLVMFMYRPEYYDIKSDEMGESTKGETHLKIAKHRNGSLDILKLKAQLSIQKFLNWDGDAVIAAKPPEGSNWRPFTSMEKYLGEREEDISF